MNICQFTCPLCLVYRFNGYCNWIICTIHNFDDRVRIRTQRSNAYFLAHVKLLWIFFLLISPLYLFSLFWERIPMVLKSLRHCEELLRVFSIHWRRELVIYWFSDLVRCERVAVEQWSKLRWCIYYLIEINEKFLIMSRFDEIPTIRYYLVGTGRPNIFYLKNLFWKIWFLTYTVTP